jgi:Notch 1
MLLLFAFCFIVAVEFIDYLFIFILENPCYNYCQNNGNCTATCTDSDCQNPICSCSDSFTGNRCEHRKEDDNPCGNNPCKNGGHCLNTLNTYVCQCLPSYGGSHCDILLNVCIPNPCLNHGECSQNSSHTDELYQCTCPKEYIGIRCEYRRWQSIVCSLFSHLISCFVQVNPCVSSPCQNNGQCMLSTSNCSSSSCSHYCRCPNDTTGTYCERFESPCSTGTCLNGGICQLDIMMNRTSCLCPSNSTGHR